MKLTEEQIALTNTITEEFLESCDGQPPEIGINAAVFAIEDLILGCFTSDEDRVSALVIIINKLNNQLAKYKH